MPGPVSLVPLLRHLFCLGSEPNGPAWPHVRNHLLFCRVGGTLRRPGKVAVPVPPRSDGLIHVWLLRPPAVESDERDVNDFLRIWHSSLHAVSIGGPAMLLVHASNLVTCRKGFPWNK
jgi:hypothetical protein